MVVLSFLDYFSYSRHAWSFGCSKSFSLSCCVDILDERDEISGDDKEGIRKQTNDWTRMWDMLSNDEIGWGMVSQNEVSLEFSFSRKVWVWYGWFSKNVT